MEVAQLIRQIRTLFPAFKQTELIEKIAASGQWLEIPAGEQIMDAGDLIRIVPLVVSGSVKIIREDEDGHEIFLYYVTPGESCAMTLASCVRREKSAVKAIVESPAHILALPVQSIYDFMHQYPSWNEFMAETYARRFDEILAVVDNIAFRKMDERLQVYLTNKSKLLGTKTLTLSKTDVAKDLNSSREVISRLMKQMEKNRMINMSGSTIELLI